MKQKVPVLLVILLWIGCCSFANEKSKEDPATKTDERYAFKNAYANSIGIEFVLIQPGSFMMGSHGDGDELPLHQVKISKPFYMGKTEVTQEQWYNVMGNNPARFKTEKVGMSSRKHPVEFVSWNEVQQFIHKLNQMEGGDHYRLPTEAEWEYAARAGTTTKWVCGNHESCLTNFAWYHPNSFGLTHPVAKKEPNPWGLYDTAGNVWEWVSDWHDSDYYSYSPSIDPQGANSGTFRVFRGGNWSRHAVHQRSANRTARPPDYRYHGLGFRLARNP